jgi:hypothetical protein
MGEKYVCIKFALPLQSIGGYVIRIMRLTSILETPRSKYACVCVF